MNSVRNGLPPRSNLPPVGPGSSASGLTKRQSPYLVVLVASHYLLGSPLLVGAVYVSRKSSQGIVTVSVDPAVVAHRTDEDRFSTKLDILGICGVILILNLAGSSGSRGDGHHPCSGAFHARRLMSNPPPPFFALFLR